MINLVDGKKLSEEILLNIKEKIENFNKEKRRPTLVVITVGDDPASKVYVRNKQKACEKCKINFINEIFDESVSRKEVSEKIKELNENENVDGIILQLPVPKDICGVEQEISVRKDVDGFNIYNLGNALYGNKNEKKLEPCTPLGIMYMLEKYNIELKGKHVVIIGRSNIVGKPLIGMLLNKDATVTSCNSHTVNIKEITSSADILITAIGKAKLVNSSYISDKTDVIIDVGINRDETGKICGDVDFEDITKSWENSTKQKYITPVPGGVGPMTVASLIKNVVMCYEKNKKI